jgi:hypothetical protein
MALNRLGADLLYTIANLVTTSAFPRRTQEQVGGVFNILTEIGKSVGIATLMIIARHVSTGKWSNRRRGSPQGLLG